MNRAATTNMPASDEDFILGDDFDAIMAALEDNEEFEVHFEEAVEEVSMKDWLFDGQTRSGSKSAGSFDLFTHTCLSLADQCLFLLRSSRSKGKE